MSGIIRLRSRHGNLPLPFFPAFARRWRFFTYAYDLIVAGVLVLQFATTTLAIELVQTLPRYPALLLRLPLFWLAALAIANTVLYLLHARSGSKGQQVMIAAWVYTRYGVILPDIAAKLLTRPTQDVSYIYGDWSSLPVNVLHEGEDESESYVEVRLCRDEDRWFLYSPDYGKELPSIEPTEIEQRLLPVLKEIVEHNGVYVVAPDEEDWTGSVINATDVDTGEQALLFWTDQLRAELWLGGTPLPELPEDQRLVVKELDYFGFLNGFMEIAREHYTAVGVNWGADGYAAFTPKELTRFFNEHLSAVENDDDDEEGEDD